MIHPFLSPTDDEPHFIAHLERDDFKVIALVHLFLHFAEHGYSIPRTLADAISVYDRRSTRNCEIARFMASRSKPMDPEQVDAFWRQLYFFAFANYGIPVPARTNMSLQDMRRVLNEQQANTEDEPDAVMYPVGDGGDFTPQEFIALQYFEAQVMKYSQYVGVTPLVRRMLEGWTTDDGEVQAFMQGQINIAACNCPYCWDYMEGLPLFMEHLWIKHAVIERQDESPDTIEGEPQESENREEAAKAKVQRDVEEQERKDSGYSDTMTIEETTARYAETAELGSPPVKYGNLYPELMSPSVSTLSPEVELSPPSATQPNMDATFWHNMFILPMSARRKSMQAGQDVAPEEISRAGRQALLNELQVAERRAQQVRDEISPPSWYNPYQGWVPFESSTKIPSPSRAGKPVKAQPVSYKNFSLSRALGSQVDDESCPPLEVPSAGSSSLLPQPASEPRCWVCEHDPDCQMRFESLVVYLEHLTERGYIVYKKWHELHPQTLLTSMNLRTSAKGI
jgi:hypothetical protein